MPEDNALFPYIFKHASLKYESELRAIFFGSGTSTSPFGIALAVDLAILVEEIRVAPATEDWRRDIVTDVVGRYGVSAVIKRSEVDRDHIF